MSARRVYSWSDRRWYVVSEIGRTLAPDAYQTMAPPMPNWSVHASSCPAYWGTPKCDCGVWPPAAAP